MKRLSIALLLAVLVSCAADAPARQSDSGFVSLFNGKDFTGWKVPEGDNGHWKIIDGVIDYDAQSESTADKNLWSEREYTNFELHVDWRIKETPYVNPNVPYILPDGTHAESGGLHGAFELGGSAAGAEDSGFDQHACLPITGMHPRAGPTA